MVTHASLHHIILSQIIENGYAPDVKKLATLLSATEQEVEQGLYALQEYHGVVLHPDKPKVWVIHPFSLAPTNFLVKSAKGKWWGNCAWCSLGIAALLKEDVEITTSFGAHGEPVTIYIKDGEIQGDDLYIHFPIPMKNAWDNVIYTCTTMLLFKNEAEIDQWVAQHGIPKGDIRPISQIWAFSKKWYGNHLAKDWKKWTKEEAKVMFAEFGLDHPIWQLDETLGRF